MDSRCTICPCLCNRLDSHEQPVFYDFASLTVHDVTELIQAILSDYDFWQLEVLKEGMGNNWKFLFKPKVKDIQNVWLTLSAEDKTSGGTSLTFNYQVPEECHAYPPVIAELTGLVKHAVDLLSYTDRLLTSRVLKPAKLG